MEWIIFLQENKAGSHFGFDRINIFAKPKHSQIWVETVIYTVIGLAIIGIVLSVATPSINQYKDKIVIEQTIEALNNFNNKVLEAKEGVGSRRFVELGIKRGKLTINSQENKIVYVLEESVLEYSEVGAEVQDGDIKIKTEKKGKKYNINLILAYSDINITYNGADKEKTLNVAPTPYKLFIENKGIVGDKIVMDIKESS